MKILILIPCLLRGGTETQTLYLVKVLIAAGHSLTTICYFEHDLEVVQLYRQSGSSVELMELKRDISSWKFINLLRKQFKMVTPDVVHVQYMAPGSLPIIAARLARVKRIFATVHQPWTTNFHGLKAKILLRISAMLATQFIVVSENAEKSWFGNSELFDVTKSKTTRSRHFTIHNSVDLIQIDKIISQVNIAETKATLELENVIVIGAVSRLRYEKGIDLLLEAFSQLVLTNNHIRLIIVGSGPDEASLKRYTKERKISDKVIFTGNRSWDDAISLMKLMDIVVCPSRFEGFGLTAAEAMAVSKPVIASSVFGLKEVVISGKTGLTFTSENVEELTHCLISLIRDVPLQNKFGQFGRERIQCLFSRETFERKIVALYK